MHVANSRINLIEIEFQKHMKLFNSTFDRMLHFNDDNISSWTISLVSELHNNYLDTCRTS